MNFYAVLPWIAAGVILVAVIVRLVKSSRERNVRRNSGRNTSRNTSVSDLFEAITPSQGAASSADNSSSSSEPATVLGPVNYYANVKHNQKDNWFQFEYKKVNGEWLAYILRMPDLNGSDPNLHYTHRYKKDGRYWVCYDPQPKNLKDAQTISKGWADRELEYITTGVHFEDQVW